MSALSADPTARERFREAEKLLADDRCSGKQKLELTPVDQLGQSQETGRFRRCRPRNPAPQREVAHEPLLQPAREEVNQRRHQVRLDGKPAIGGLHAKTTANAPHLVREGFAVGSHR